MGREAVATTLIVPMPELNDVILVTGSSGLIGSALIQAVADRFRIIGFGMRVRRSDQR